MKSIQSLFICLLLTTFSQAQKPCILSNQLESFVRIGTYTPGVTMMVYANVDSTPAHPCLNEYIMRNIGIVDYLLQNYRSKVKDSLLLLVKDSVQNQRNGIAYLNADTAFMSKVKELDQKVILKTIPRDTISFARLTDIAVKFFIIRGINDKGQYKCKVCTGINDIKKTETQNHPFIEAFCITSIFKHVASEEIPIYAEFIANIKDLYNYSFGIDKNEQLLRAQGALYMAMGKSEMLKKLLLLEYERCKDDLPFVVKIP